VKKRGHGEGSCDLGWGWKENMGRAFCEQSKAVCEQIRPDGQKPRVTAMLGPEQVWCVQGTSL
jgi:hypothetical protein